MAAAWPSRRSHATRVERGKITRRGVQTAPQFWPVVAGETNLPIAAHDRRHTESADREYLASNIAALMNKNAEKDPGLKPILVLHVEFVKRGLWSKTVDAIEFRRRADGKFARHQT